MVFIVILSSILLAVCTSLKPLYLQNAIDAVEAGTGDARAMFICYLVSILGILLFETARQLSTGKYRNGKLFGLKKQVMAHIIHMPPRKFQEEQGQNYVTTLNNEIEMLVDSFYVTRLELAYSILVLVACVVALLYINGYLAMIIIVSTVCPIVASAVQGQALEKRTNLYTMALEKLNVMIGNLIHGYPTIKVNHVEREYLQTLEQDNEDAAHAEFAKSKTKVRVNMIIGLLSSVPVNSGSVSSVYPAGDLVSVTRYCTPVLRFSHLATPVLSVVILPTSVHVLPSAEVSSSSSAPASGAPVASTLRTVMLPLASTFSRVTLILRFAVVMLKSYLVSSST